MLRQERKKEINLKMGSKDIIDRKTDLIGIVTTTDKRGIFGIVTKVKAVF
jgi:hypothetical protein